VELKVENIHTILDTLIWDGDIEGIEDPNGPSFLGGKSSIIYRPTKIAILDNGFTQSPCGVCPVFNDCHDEGEITPLKCLYLKNWLDFSY